MLFGDCLWVFMEGGKDTRRKYHTDRGIFYYAIRLTFLFLYIFVYLASLESYYIIRSTHATHLTGRFISVKINLLCSL